MAEVSTFRRLDPRAPDLLRWREVFAEKLRDWGIEAQATARVTRGSRHHSERPWQRKSREVGREVGPVTEGGDHTDTKLTPAPPGGAGVVRDGQCARFLGRDGRPRTGPGRCRRADFAAPCAAREADVDLLQRGCHTMNRRMEAQTESN